MNNNSSNNSLNPWKESPVPPPAQTLTTSNTQSIYMSGSNAIKYTNTESLKPAIDDFNKKYGNTFYLLIALMKVAIQYQNIQAVQILLDNGYNKTWHINYNEDGYTMVTAHKAAEIQRGEYKKTGYASTELDTIIKLLKPSEGGKRKSRGNKRKNNKSRKQHSRRR